MNLKFTPEERRVILYILYAIMCADEIVHPKEMELFNTIYEKIGADASDIDTIEHITEDHVRIVISTMSYEKKNYFITILNDMAKVDGFVDYRERLLIDSYFSVESCE